MYNEWIMPVSCNIGRLNENDSSIDDYRFNLFIVNLGATYYVSMIKQLG